MSYRFLFYTPLAIIGFKPVDIILMDQITFFYQLIIHTEIIRSWGFLEWFMNTPSHHRVHHASNPQYMDKNFAAIFIIWDRLFGTFAKEVEKPVYGLLRNLETENIIIVSFHEFIAMIRDIAKARSFSEVMNLLFNHPGWKISHLPRKSFLASLQTGS
jgi:sterol desaturase/sphingolipid hydroxylase (fatty acid hydroxylase superfamily)